MVNEFYANHHGVLVKKASLGRAVSVFGQQLFDEIPKCCWECNKLDVECGENGVQLSPYHCGNNLAFPIKKGTCKRQNK